MRYDTLKVKLRSVTGERVYFNVTPDLNETRSVNYSIIEPAHAPGTIAAFKNTSSRIFTISNAKLIARTQGEAQRNLHYLQYLRSWTTPRFGTMTLDERQRILRSYQHQDLEYADDQGGYDQVIDNGEYGTELIGAPPAVIYLTAHSHETNKSTLQNIVKVPTVIQSLSINYPSDVDYIPSTTNIPVPTIMTVDITLMETHSPGEYQTFSLGAFRKGILGNF